MLLDAQKDLSCLFVELVTKIIILLDQDAVMNVVMEIGT